LRFASLGNVPATTATDLSGFATPATRSDTTQGDKEKNYIICQRKLLTKQI
jgi:hypothetical protein